MQLCCKIRNTYYENRASKVALGVKSLPANKGDTRDVGSIPGSGKSPGVGNIFRDSASRMTKYIFVICTIAFISHTSKVMLKILQARL